MFLTGQLMSKSNFFGSLLNRCRSQIGANTRVQVAGLKTLEEQIGLPPRPKKPLTPYFRFLVVERPKLLKARPSLKAVEVVREVAKMWVTADPSMKKKLEEEYKKEQESYLELRTKYDATITMQQREEIKKAREDRQLMRARREHSKRNRQMGRPKRPLNGFLRFLADERLKFERPKSMNYHEWFRVCGEKWTKLSQADRAVYNKNVEKDYEKYRQEMVVWEQKMLEQGNVDLIRSTALVAEEVPKEKHEKRKNK